MRGDNGVPDEVRHGRHVREEVEVAGEDGLWEEEALRASDQGTPVTALGDIFVVSQLDHEFVHCNGVLLDAEAFLWHVSALPPYIFGKQEAGHTYQLWCLREAITRERRCNDMESWIVISSLGQEWKQLLHFDEASWPCRTMSARADTSTPFTPHFCLSSHHFFHNLRQFVSSIKGILTSMHEQQRDGSLHLTPCMHKMKIQLPILLLRLNLCRELRQLIQVRFGFAPVKGVLPVFSDTFNVMERRALSPACVFWLVGKSREGELLFEEGEGAAPRKKRSPGTLTFGPHARQSTDLLILEIMSKSRGSE